MALIAVDQDDLMKWARALEHVAFKYKSKLDEHRHGILEEENDLYDSIYADGDDIFRVNLHESETNCMLKPKTYAMHLTSNEIQLKNVNGVDVVASWPYQYIRNYKCVDDKITFEAGRKCKTGEGEYIFQHATPKLIFRQLRKKMKAMKKSMSAVNVVIDEEDLNAAMSMEAGSRCPLIFTDGDSNQGSHLILGVLSNASMNSVALAPTAAMKFIPLKPKRQSMLTDADEKPSNIAKQERPTAFSDYEPIEGEQTTTNDLSRSFRRKAIPQSLTLIKCRIQNTYDYDHIQSPTDASMNSVVWEEQSMNTVELAGNQSPDLENSSPGMNRRVPVAFDDSYRSVMNDEEQYDKLDFFAPNQSTPSTEYPELVVKSSVACKRPFPVASDDYEIVGENTMNELKYLTGMPGVQKAAIDRANLSKVSIDSDDLSKTSGDTDDYQRFADDADDLLNHSQVNGLDYAIVSKPKQV